MTIEMVDTQDHDADGIVLIDQSGAVWRTFSRPWWDVLSWVIWLLEPGLKRTVVTSHAGGRKSRVRAVRISRRHVRMGS